MKKQKFGSLAVLFTFTIFLLANYTAFGQDANWDRLKQLASEDSATVEALVMYPQDVRVSMFETARYPQSLIEMDALQVRSSREFRNIIVGYDRETQEIFYDIMRYPNLIDSLVVHGKLSRRELKGMLENYPEDIRESSADVGRKEFETLQKIRRVDIESRDAYKKLLAKYPENLRMHIDKLLGLPEVLQLMIGNLELTSAAGLVYAEDPKKVLQMSEELNLKIARENAEELEDYKALIESDPDAYKDMIASGEQYCEDNDLKEYRGAPAQKNVTYNVVYSYPYWFGYPWWWEYPWWRPYPWYWHTGFYYNWDGSVVIIGLPSYYYVWWQWYYYPYRYHNLYTHYYRHYRRHPHSYNSFTEGVREHVTGERTFSYDKQVTIEPYRGVPGQTQPVDGVRDDKAKPALYNREPVEILDRKKEPMPDKAPVDQRKPTDKIPDRPVQQRPREELKPDRPVIIPQQDKPIQTPKDERKEFKPFQRPPVQINTPNKKPDYSYSKPAFNIKTQSKELEKRGNKSLYGTKQAQPVFKPAPSGKKTLPSRNNRPR